jgi:peptidoglycan hydrolase-like protein with peptidoglycan-binding domain
LTAQTPAAVRAFQRRDGLPVSGLLDDKTRRELAPGLDPIRQQSHGRVGLIPLGPNLAKIKIMAKYNTVN